MSPSTESAAAFELVVTAGNAKGATIPMAKARLAFGSAQGNDVRLSEAGVRPSHAELAVAADGAVWIRDLTGVGETSVNGAPVATARLENGAFIRLGTVEMCLRRKNETGPMGTMRSVASGPNPASSTSGSNSAARTSGSSAAAGPGSRPKTGPNDTYMRPSVSAAGDSPASRPKSGPNDTMMRPSGSSTAANTGSGPNDTVMRPSGTSRSPATEQQDGYMHQESGAQPASFESPPGEGYAQNAEPMMVAAMLRPDQVIADRYRIVAKLAAGGMGEVYKVEHVELGKPFALKVMRKEMSSDPEFVERFKREAITASRIGQQNIVDISDFGRTEAGLFYFVMEFLQGETVADLLKRERVLTLGRALPIIMQICRALGAAHRQGIVHRDLKPENVMLLQRPEQPDFVKVLDFGVAKVADGAGRGGQTALGIVLGTPQYMAPEQAAGLPVDARSDVYSLGLIIYELIAGHAVFEEATPSLLMVAHINRAPPPMTPGPISLPLPEGLEPLVMRMLAKKAVDRPQTMDEVAMALEACLPGLSRRSSGSWGASRPSSGASVAASAPPSSGPLPAQRAPISGSMGALATGMISGPVGATSGQMMAMPTGTTGAMQAQVTKSKAPLFAVGALVAVAAISAAIFFGLRGPAPVTPPAPVVNEVKPVVPPTPVADPVPAVPKPEIILLSLTSKPERVDVYEGENIVGATPTEIKWERGKEAHLRFVADGYLPETKNLKPIADLKYEVVLKPKPKAVVPKKPVGGGADDPDLKDAPF